MKLVKHKTSRFCSAGTDPEKTREPSDPDLKFSPGSVPALTFSFLIRKINGVYRIPWYCTMFNVYARYVPNLKHIPSLV